VEIASRTKRLGIVAGACLALTACGSLEQDELVFAGAPLQTVTTVESDLASGATSSSIESLSQTPNIQASDSEGESQTSDGSTTTTATVAETTTEAPTTTVAETTTTESTETTDSVAPESTSTTVVSTTEAEVAVASAQIQDDDDEMEELPRTGSANGVLLLIAIGCAMIVGGRTLIDLMNAAARAIQKSTVRSAPPR